MSTFGKNALLFEDGTGLTSEDRLKLALTEPLNTNALTQSQAKAVTQNRIRNALAQLAHGNVENVQRWLNQVGEQSPAKAIELYMQLCEYSLPKLKAVAVEVRANTTVTDVRNLSMADLERMATDPSIVSEQ